MLRGRMVAGGGVAVTTSARVRSSPWEDARKKVAPVRCSTFGPSACQVIRKEAQPTVGVRCLVPDVSLKWKMSVSLGMGRSAIAVGMIDVDRVPLGGSGGDLRGLQ